MLPHEHPDYPALKHRLQKLQANAEKLSCTAFRMIKPEYHTEQDILSGIGGYRSCGRWCLRKRFHCSYLSYAPETALSEILVSARRKNLPDSNALPRVLVSLKIKLHHVLDLTDGSMRQHVRVSKKQMVEESWWKENYYDREAITQAMGRAAATTGFEGIIVPSASDQPHGINLVIFTENLRTESLLHLETPITWNK